MTESLKFGYNTNGAAFHRWEQALELMAEIGYRSVALTVDHHCLDPFHARLNDEIARMRESLERLQFISVIETGSRFLLNSRVKHDPTLMDPSTSRRSIRIDFLKRCVDIAAELGSQAVSFWSGVLTEQISQEQAMDRLVAGCETVVEYAEQRGVNLAFEPEPGMFVETMNQFDQLCRRIDSNRWGLTLDVGHVHCVSDGPIADCIHRWKDRLFNVHIEDMRKGIHDHLPFGEGEIDFPPIIQALQQIGYRGGVNVELSRHGHAAPQMMRESFEFLRNCQSQTESE